MKFSIQSRRDAQSNELMELAKTYLQDFGLTYDEETPEIVVSIGGDGTLLHAFHRYSHLLDQVAFVGIHTGTFRILCGLETFRTREISAIYCEKRF